MDDAHGAPLLRDRYEAIDVLERGGQREVWKAIDHQHDRVVALKIRSLPDRGERDRVLAEARALLSLRPHPGLPLVRDDFFWDDRHVLVMDWTDGTDLGALLLQTGDPGLPVSSALTWLDQAAAAIDHLHAHGVVHGDVKPANLVLGPDGHVVLVDIGSSREGNDDSPHSSGARAYTAPESDGGAVSGAADVYGLAATAVALLTGAPPSGVPHEWVDVPNAVAIERAIRRGLAVDPAQRPRTARELIERLHAHVFLDLPTGVVTFLLTDIEGSTLRWEAEPDAMADLLASHDGVMAEAVEASGGRLLKTRGEGDSTFSVFIRASDAIAAAVTAQRGLRASTGLSVRMAVHTGEAELRDGDYFGRTVNRAARLRAIGHGGQILLSSAAADLVRDALPDDSRLVDLGYRELRDLARGEQVFALAHPDLAPIVVEAEAEAGAASGPAAVGDNSTPVTPNSDTARAESDVPADSSPRVPPVRSPFPPALATTKSDHRLDRDEELSRLRDAWRVASSGQRHLVIVGGDVDAVTQLCETFAGEAYRDGASVLYGRCEAASDVPFEPFAMALRQALADAEVTGAVPVLGRLGGELVRMVPDVDTRPLGLSPPIRADALTEQYRLFDAVTQWLQAFALVTPTVLVLDELQRAALPTGQLLRHVFRSTEACRLLVLGIHRDTDVRADHPMTELLADLGRAAGAERIAL